MIKRFIMRLARESRGGTAIEYGLIMALIMLTMMGAVIGVANTTITMWNNVSTKVEETRKN
jgi:pilus assembly protein Flp/PilA